MKINLRRIKRRTALATALVMLMAGFTLNCFLKTSVEPKERKPNKKISMYFDMELTINGKVNNALTPPMSAILGEKSSALYSGYSNFLLISTIRPYQTEGMDSQEALLEYEIAKIEDVTMNGTRPSRSVLDSMKGRNILESSLIKIRNQEKTVVFIEFDPETKETLVLTVKPYFGPKKEEVASR